MQAGRWCSRDDVADDQCGMRCTLPCNALTVTGGHYGSEYRHDFCLLNAPHLICECLLLLGNALQGDTVTSDATMNGEAEPHHGGSLSCRTVMTTRTAGYARDVPYRDYKPKRTSTIVDYGLRVGVRVRVRRITIASSALDSAVVVIIIITTSSLFYGELPLLVVLILTNKAISSPPFLLSHCQESQGRLLLGLK